MGGSASFFSNHCPSCLLYTSDAADEEDSVDLGGCRTIKKKKEERGVDETRRINNKNNGRRGGEENGENEEKVREE